MPLRLAAVLSALSCLQTLYATVFPAYDGEESATLQRRNSTGLTNDVTWDPHSLSILGQRTFILSAEIHPWRQPNPDLWSDVFQKVKANGFNTVSFYVNWATHFPTPDTNGGDGDFATGTYRDIQKFIDDAKDAGLWMIARFDFIFFQEKSPDTLYALQARAVHQ